MARRSRKPAPPPPVPITYAEDWQANGRHVTRGTEVSIRGVTGRFRFYHHAAAPRGSWVTVWGPVGRKHDAPTFRSFDPARIRTVHRLRTSRPTQ